MGFPNDCCFAKAYRPAEVRASAISMILLPQYCDKRLPTGNAWRTGVCASRVTSGIARSFSLSLSLSVSFSLSSALSLSLCIFLFIFSLSLYIYRYVHSPAFYAHHDLYIYNLYIYIDTHSLSLSLYVYIYNSRRPGALVGYMYAFICLYLTCMYTRTCRNSLCQGTS